MSRSLSILGSTGSVGTATIDVALSNPDLFSVDTLTAQSNVDLLAEQAIKTSAKLAVIGDETKLAVLREKLSGHKTETAGGRAAIIEAAGRGADITMAAIVGMAGLEPITAAIARGKHVAIANKEPLVAAGPFVIVAAKKSGATLLPVDSEHNAIFQVFEQENRAAIRRIILTASGGPFREWSIDQMRAATPAQAVAHPNWSMGAKISVDSASMMNKALEVIEAHYLFDLPPEQIDVMLHPQSVIHSMVEYEDGSVLAQMGASDMRVPITHALGWPGRIGGPAQRLDLAKLSTLNFGTVDERRFPAIKHAYDCIRHGLGACIAFNAANEIAVAAFLDGRIGFLDIEETVGQAIEKTDFPSIDGLESVLAFDVKMRDSAQSYIVELENRTRKVS